MLFDDSTGQVGTDMPAFQIFIALFYMQHGLSNTLASRPSSGEFPHILPLRAGRSNRDYGMIAADRVIHPPAAFTVRRNGIAYLIGRRAASRSSTEANWRQLLLRLPDLRGGRRQSMEPGCGRLRGRS